MNKKGFTLIELLAVIVILAIIMLIATPLILGVVSDAKKGAARNSAMGYVDALEKQIIIDELKNEGSNKLYNTIISDITLIQVRGNNPKNVSLSILDGIVVSGTVTFGDYTFNVSNGNVGPEPVTTD